MGGPYQEAKEMEKPSRTYLHSDEGIPFSADPANMTESESIMSDAPHGLYDPPPHLAARFYRSRVGMRRKSSAQSSRRNSHSSVHSRSSSLSSRHVSQMACQSNSVAQHLRRASILESRKARLADRAAHAEQVRLRAAVVKATPRGSITNSEEKALAAQLAKEKYLAKVAAACAEEVARAKRVAEEVKERKLAEEVRARSEMEEKHAEAQRRREEWQRNLQGRRRRRSQSTEKTLGLLEAIVDVDESTVIAEEDERDLRAEAKSLQPEEASRRIRYAWNRYQRGKTVRRLTDIDIHTRSTQESFEEMTALVAEETTISAAVGVLTLLGLQERDDDNAALNTRTFLSAYMIYGHPVEVLNKKGAQEQHLMQKCKDLVEQFESCVNRLARTNNFTPNSTQLESLSQAYSAYTSAFAAWRLQDSSVLIEGMVASFVELDAIWQTVKDDTRGEVANDYREGIRDNQVMLLSRIRKLAGSDRADTLIKKAIRESRKRRPKKRPFAEVRPRGVRSEQGPVGPDPAALDSAETAVEAVSIPGVEQRYDSSDDAALTELFTPMPSNRKLTHELAIDKDFRLEDTTSAAREQLYRSICDSMKHGFELGDGLVWTVSAAENIREKLLRMLTPGNSMHSLISETLELDLIQQQCRAGVFSYDGFFQFMANMLPKLCAPFRDDEMKALVKYLHSHENGDVGAMTEKLFRVLRMVDCLSMDYTNFMIMNAAPTLIREAAGYEQRMFAKDLEAGIVSLEKTRRWWQVSFTQLSAEADRRDPEGIRNPADRPTSLAVFGHALIGLALDPGQLQVSSVPETLMLDLERLRTLRAKAVRITVIGALLLTAKNLLKRDSRSQWKNVAGRLWQLLSVEDWDTRGSEGLTTAHKAFGMIESAQNLPPATKDQLWGTTTRFFGQAADVVSRSPTRSTAKFTDPVLKVLHQRLRTHVSTRLLAATPWERVRAASNASEALAGFGMPEFVTHVGEMIETLERVREVDWQAHGMWHHDIFRQLEEGWSGNETSSGERSRVGESQVIH